MYWRRVEVFSDIKRVDLVLNGGDLHKKKWLTYWWMEKNSEEMEKLRIVGISI